MTKKDKKNTVKSVTSLPMKPAAAARLTKMSIYTGPIGLLVAVIALLIAVSGMGGDPVDSQKEIRSADRVKAWSVDFMTVWLGGSDTTADGSSQSVATLEAMSSAPGGVKLPPTPYRVNKLNAVIDTRTDVGMGDYVWSVRIDAHVVAPGGQAVRKYTFALPVTQSGDDFQATAHPTQISVITRPFEVVSAYKKEARVESPLGHSVKAFGSAYLTPSSGDAALGSTTSSRFTGVAVGQSLWSQVSLDSVLWYHAADSQFDIDKAKESDEVKVLATFTGSTSSSTFSTVQMPLTMVLLANGQWVVDSLDAEVLFNDIAPVR